MLPEYRKQGIAALLFDFDGTLAVPMLDFRLMREAAVAAMRRHVAVPDRPELPTMELLALIGTATDTARAATEAALRAVRDVEIAAAQQSSLFPFVRPMLARLPTLGLRMAIVTRNCREAVTAVFPDVEEHCLLLTRDDVGRVKPDPEHLHRALHLLDLQPAQALMVGDHTMDIEVGKRACTRTAGVLTGEKNYHDMAACQPDYLAADGGELMRMLGIT